VSWQSWIWRLRRDSYGLAAIEFALGAPMLMVLGGYGAEVANLAITNMRVSQFALQLADNAARIGVNSGLSTFQVREADINDVMQGLRLFSGSSDLAEHGRVTLSSLENTQQTWDTAPAQRIHWQRCLGQRGGTNDTAYDSEYTTNKTDGTVAAMAEDMVAAMGMVVATGTAVAMDVAGMASATCILAAAIMAGSAARTRSRDQASPAMAPSRRAGAAISAGCEMPRSHQAICAIRSTRCRAAAHCATAGC